MPHRPPSAVLLLAMALADESRSALRDLGSGREVKRTWAQLGRDQRSFWTRKAARVLARGGAVGLEARRAGG